MVFGVGGIGVNVLQTARLLDAARVVAVDVNHDKADAARHFGADEVVVAPHTATGEELVALGACRRGCAGRRGRRVQRRTRRDRRRARGDRPRRHDRAGRHPAPRGEASFDVNALLRNRRVVGSLNGTVDVPRDFPVIVDHARRGDLDLAAQVSRVWPLAEIDDAIAAVRAGQVVRAVLDHTT